jgi:hypothetical protein
LAGVKRITPFLFQAPPRGLGASHRVTGGPPVISIFLSLPPAPKPT